MCKNTPISGINLSDMVEVGTDIIRVDIDSINRNNHPIRVNNDPIYISKDDLKLDRNSTERNDLFKNLYSLDQIIFTDE